MLKDDFCTSEPPRCVILRGALWRLAFPGCNRDAADDGISTESVFRPLRHPFDRQKGGQKAQKVAGENKKSVFGVVGMKIIMYFCYTTKKD